MTMYVVEVKEMYCDSRIGLITEEQEKKAIASHVRQYIDYSINGDYDSMLRWAEALPKTFALNTANEMEKALRQKGLTIVTTQVWIAFENLFEDILPFIAISVGVETSFHNRLSDFLSIAVERSLSEVLVFVRQKGQSQAQAVALTIVVNQVKRSILLIELLDSFLYH